MTIQNINNMTTTLKCVLNCEVLGLEEIFIFGMHFLKNLLICNNTW
jgi:hypothetical protein